MGLCKCPKRKVTNQFCFEHRVNVCEDCMLANHTKCVVQSYVQWLQDSDYSPICELCHSNLTSDDCVRLICYHVFHWHCLDQYARAMPSNTAPAGYACPTCKEGLFPRPNLVSPVADRLKSLLSRVNWARVGLGLPLVDETLPVSSRSAPDGGNNEELVRSSQEAIPSSHREFPPSHESVDWKQTTLPVANVSNSRPQVTEFVNVIATSSSSSAADAYPLQATPYTSLSSSGLFSPKRMYDARDSGAGFGLGNASFDHDENKYRRRSALEWFARWFKTMSNPPSWRRLPPDPHRRLKRRVMIAVLMIVGMATLVLVMWRLGRANADFDPFLDPAANPNIRVVEEEVVHDAIES